MFSRLVTESARMVLNSAERNVCEQHPGTTHEERHAQRSRWTSEEKHVTSPENPNPSVNAATRNTFVGVHTLSKL